MSNACASHPDKEKNVLFSLCLFICHIIIKDNDQIQCINYAQEQESITTQKEHYTQKACHIIFAWGN